MRLSRMRPLLVLVLSVSAVWPAGAAARPGDLDRSFGAGHRGYVEMSFRSDESTATDLLVRRDGSIVAVGNTRQYSPSGSVDRLALVILRRDGRRKAVNQVGFSPGAPFARAVAVGRQPAGRIVVVGRASDAVSHLFVALAGFTPAGRLDRSFGDGGRVLLPLGGTGSLSGWVHDAAVDSRGRTVVSGLSGGRRFVRRFLPGGLPDPGFGTEGVVVEPASPEVGNAIAVDRRGRVVLAGYERGAVTLVRLREDGARDNSFGSGGVAEIPLAGSSPSRPPITDVVSLPRQEGYAVAGAWRGRLVVARFTPGGRGARFGTRGIARIGSAVYGDVSVARQPGGELVLAGAAYVRTVLGRLTRGGRPDRTFGRRGVKFHSFGNHDGTTPNAVATQRGRLLVAGEDSLDERIDYSTYFTVARFRL